MNKILKKKLISSVNDPDDKCNIFEFESSTGNNPKCIVLCTTESRAVV